MIASALDADSIVLQGVVSRGVLFGLSLRCVSRLTLLLDADPESGAIGGAALALRLLAGIERPSAGSVQVFGIEPANDATLRRHIALLGDAVLLDRCDDEVEAARSLGAARGVGTELLQAIAEDARAPAGTARRISMTDRLAAPDRARLVLLSHPERYTDAARREASFQAVRAAIARGAHAIVATRRLDDLLALASDGETQAAIITRGIVTAVGPAHGLPWALPLDGIATRVVLVSLARLLRSDGDQAGGVSPAAALVADLLTDPEVAPEVAAAEQLSPTKVRLHVRNPRAVVRAITRRAHAGTAIRRLTVHGADAQPLAAAFDPIMGARR